MQEVQGCKEKERKGQREHAPQTAAAPRHVCHAGRIGKDHPTAGAGAKLRPGTKASGAAAALKVAAGQTLACGQPGGAGAHPGPGPEGATTPKEAGQSIWAMRVLPRGRAGAEGQWRCPAGSRLQSKHQACRHGDARWWRVASAAVQGGGTNARL